MKILLTIISLILGFIPTEIYILIASVLNPTGFWQKLVVFGGGVWLLGGLQILFLILLVCVLAVIWEKA